MKNVEEMKGKMYTLIDEVRNLAATAEKEDRALSAEEREKKDKMMDSIRDMEKDITAEEEMQRVEAQRAKSPDADPEKSAHEWKSLGEFVKTALTNPNDKRLANREVEGRQANQSMGDGAQGGFLVPEQFSDQLLTVSPDEAIVRPRATVFESGDSDFKIPALQYSGNNMFAGAEVTWIDEGNTKPQTDIQFKQITLQPYEVAGHVRVTDKLLRNAPVIEQIVSTQLRRALIDAEEEVFLTNSGNVANAPNPIIGDAATITIGRDTDNEVQYEDVINMFSRFRGQRAVWIVNRGVIPQLMGMKDDGDVMVWQPNAREGNPGTLLGYPVLYSDNSPSLGSTGDVVLADLSYYLIRDGIGVAIAASPHVEFTNNITYIKAFKTVDGKPWLSGPLPTDPTSSPFVELEAF